MIRLISLLLISFFIHACFSSSNNLNYDNQNKRFDYSSVISFKNSLSIHFNNDSEKFDLKELDNIETTKSSSDDLNLFKETSNHEQLVEMYPNKIYKFILYLNEYKFSEKIIFETMQSYLRYLTKDKTLR